MIDALLEERARGRDHASAIAAKEAEIEQWKTAALTADATRASTRDELMQTHARCAGLSDLEGDHRVRAEDSEAEVKRLCDGIALLADEWESPDAALAPASALAEVLRTLLPPGRAR